MGGQRLGVAKIEFSNQGTTVECDNDTREENRKKSPYSKVSSAWARNRAGASKYSYTCFDFISISNKSEIEIQWRKRHGSD